MSNYGKPKTITTHPDVRYRSVDEAMTAAGYTRKCAVSSVNPTNHKSLIRDIYEDEAGTLWAVADSQSGNHTVLQIVLKQYTGTPENIK
jgi:hypothetical protein